MGDIMGRAFVIKLKDVSVAFFLAAIMTAVIVFPDGAVGVKKGLYLCLSAVIPSLFLFSALSIFAFYSGAIKIIGKPFSPLSRAIFKLSAEEFSVFLLSLFSGYPVGARLLAEMYDKKKIEREKAVIMLYYCINAGPAFIVTATGQIMLNSRTDGYRLLAAHILSSLLLAAIFSLFLKNCNSQRQPVAQNETLPLSDCFVRSVSAASTSIISISAFVVLFSGLGEIIASLPLPNAVSNSIRSTLEVTVGVSLFNRHNLSVIAFLLGFAGISVQFQVLSAAANLKPNFLKLFLSRLAHGFLSFIAVEIMEKIWPRNIKTSLPPGSVSAALSGDVSASVALILMGIVLAAFTFGDKFKNCMEK